MAEDTSSIEINDGTPVFSPGDRVANKKGMIGTVNGFERRGEDDYIVVDMGAFISKFPAARFQDNFRKAKEEEKIKKQRLIDRRIKGIIDEMRSSGDGGVFSSRVDSIAEPEELSRGLEEIIKESIDMDFLFRGDLRRPEGDGGMFTTGFKAMQDPDNADTDVIYNTPFLDIAVRYPEEINIPNNTISRFVYIIDPYSIVDVGSKAFKQVDEEEITIPDIPAENIKYAIEYDMNINLKKVHTNPSYAY
ncbi:MAG TPA: hypothetical protein VG965_06320 [Patescibacteria group bacterium]|nr:hypothetical protein [Patescibacteria group bacterium]